MRAAAMRASPLLLLLLSRARNAQRLAGGDLYHLRMGVPFPIYHNWLLLLLLSPTYDFLLPFTLFCCVHSGVTFLRRDGRPRCTAFSLPATRRICVAAAFYRVWTYPAALL